MNIVLAHGIFGFQTFLGIEYFNGVKDFLVNTFQNVSLHVLVTEVSPAGTIEQRGGELGQQILRGLGQDGAANTLDPNEKVHIIAHSMGGLDARFLISPDNKDNIADRVASLTTISTPHHGSPVADLLVALIDGASLSPLHRKIAEELNEILDKIKISHGGLRNLTTEATEVFNEQYHNQDFSRVHYFSIAGRGRGGFAPSCVELIPFHRYIERQTHEDNDGLVAVSSAVWGEGDTELWPADHADEVGHDLSFGFTAKPKFDYLAKYSEIVQRLLALQ